MIAPPCSSREGAPTAFHRQCEQLASMLLRLKVAVREGRAHEDWAYRFGPATTFLAEWGLVVVLREVADTVGIRPLAGEKPLRQLLERMAQRWPHPYSPADAELLEQVRHEWAEYCRVAPVPMRDVVNREFAETMYQSLELTLSHFRPFRILDDLDVFLTERDTVEFFLIGVADAGWDPSQYEVAVAALDPQLRRALEAQAAWVAESPLDREAVPSLNVSWYPERFWWRHFCWES